MTCRSLFRSFNYMGPLLCLLAELAESWPDRKYYWRVSAAVTAELSKQYLATFANRAALWHVLMIETWGLPGIWTCPFWANLCNPDVGSCRTFLDVLQELRPQLFTCSAPKFEKC